MVHHDGALAMSASSSCCAPTCLGDLRRVRPPPRCAQKRLFKIDELEGKAISGCERGE